LNAVCPDGFEYCFVDEEVVVDRDVSLETNGFEHYNATFNTEH
jgi:hypothetical protein